MRVWREKTIALEWIQMRWQAQRWFTANSYIIQLWNVVSETSNSKCSTCKYYSVYFSWNVISLIRWERSKSDEKTRRIIQTFNEVFFLLKWMKRNNWRYQKYHLDYSDWIKVRRKQQIEVKLLSGLFFIKLRVEIILCDVSGDQCKSQK